MINSFIIFQVSVSAKLGTTTDTSAVDIKEELYQAATHNTTELHRINISSPDQARADIQPIKDGRL